MPLIASKHFKEGDDRNVRELQEPNMEKGEIQSSIQHNFSKEQQHYDFDDQEQLDEDNEDMLTRSNTLVPELPQKSHLRVSRILDDLSSLELEDLERQKTEDQESLYSNPLDLYLSSEEDGSASGDDYEDVVTDEENGENSTLMRRHSYEETATVVSFRCMKPQIVEINHHHLPASYTLDSLNKRPVSVTYSKSQPLVENLPARNSNRPPLSVDTYTLPSTKSTLPKQHSFLSSDPYPTESPASMPSPMNVHSRNSTPSPQTAKSEKTSSGWGGLRNMSRTLALARKKASVPKINLAYAAGVVQKRNSISPTQASTFSTASRSSISVLSTETNAAAPAIPPRRRSQTFDRLIRISSKEEKRDSKYSESYEYGSEEWKELPSPAYTLRSSELSLQTNSRSEDDSSSIPRRQVDASPVDIPAPPVNEIIASISDSPPAPTLQRRNRSYTTSHTSSNSIYSRSSSPSRSKINISTDSTQTRTSILAMPSSSSSNSSSASVKEINQTPRMTTLPDYSPTGRVTRECEEQRRDSGFASGVERKGSMSPGGVAGGNTYQDIMRSVTLGAKETGKETGKVLKGRTSMAMLTGMGLRRSGATRNGVKA